MNLFTLSVVVAVALISPQLPRVNADLSLASPGTLSNAGAAISSLQQRRLRRRQGGCSPKTRSPKSNKMMSYQRQPSSPSPTQPPESGGVTPRSREPSPMPATASAYGGNSNTADTNSVGQSDGNLALQMHNVRRALHQAPSMVWDSALERSAANYARTCATEHSPGSKSGQFGENLAWYKGYRVDDPIAWAIKAWYEEEKDYNYNSRSSPSNFEKVGHFTAMVWADTRKVGCAWSQCSGRWDAMIVCHYSDAIPNRVGNSDWRNFVKPSTDKAKTVQLYTNNL